MAAGLRKSPGRAMVVARHKRRPAQPGCEREGQFGEAEPCTNQPGWYWPGIAVVAAAIGTARAETLSLSCGAVGLELKLCQEGADAWAK